MPGRDTYDLLDPRTMDGPVVKYTVQDVFKSNPTGLITYHAMALGYDYLSIVGAIVGGASYVAKYRPYPNILQSIGTGSLIGGCTGVVLGLAAVAGIASKGENASPPWNADGRQQRVDGLSHNFKVRVADLGGWSGVAVAAGTVAAFGGPIKVGLSAGPFGVLQALSLGTAAGTLLSVGYLTYQDKKNALTDDDDDDNE